MVFCRKKDRKREREWEGEKKSERMREVLECRNNMYVLKWSKKKP